MGQRIKAKKNGKYKKVAFRQAGMKKRGYYRRKKRRKGGKVGKNKVCKQ